jgi:hypothetical protein
MPNRLLKEGIVDSSLIDNLTSEEEVFFYRLLVVSDDFGRMDARSAILKSRCFPLKDFKLEKIDNWLRSIVRQGLATMYKVDEKPYLQILKWEQRVRSKGKYPSPDGSQPIDIVQTFDSNSLTDDGLGKGLGMGKGEGKGNGGSRATRLSTDFELPEDWVEFCKSERPDLDAKKTFAEFKDHWIAQAGAKGVKSDWTATWRNWVRRTFAKNITTQDKSYTRWDASVASTMARGKELGILPNVGETEGQYRERLRLAGA